MSASEGKHHQHPLASTDAYASNVRLPLLLHTQTAANHGLGICLVQAMSTHTCFPPQRLSSGSCC